MLGHEDQALHAAGLGRGGDLIGVKRGGIEQRRLFIAKPPLFVGECVHPEMDEGVESEFVPGDLALGGDRSKGRGRRRGGGGPQTE